MPNRQKFDIAFSFSADDAWIGRDLTTIFKGFGLSAYFSADNPDYAGGFLRKELMNVYKNSSVNVMLWSSSYMVKAKDSIVAMEKDIIWQRHVGKGEHKTLFILNIDNAPIPEDFELCLTHNIKDIGLLKSRDYIINRLMSCFKGTLPEKGRYIHPTGREIERGRVHPCKFRLSSNYKQDKLGRWQAVADVEVVPFDTNIPRELKTFMIPSGAVPPFLSHSTLLKTDTDCLTIKSNLTIEFVKVNAKNDLQGVLFYIKRGGMDYPHIYCYEYDKFLCENFDLVDNDQ